MALKMASTGPLAGHLLGHLGAVDVERERRLLRPLGAGDDRERDDADRFRRDRRGVFHQRLDVLVVDVLLAVGEILEALEGVLEGVVAELEAQLAQLLAEGMAAECLPMTSEVAFTPTESGVMIS